MLRQFDVFKHAKPLTVFVIDDSPADRFLTQKILEGIGFIDEIVNVQDASEFIEQVLFKERYNQLESRDFVILLDLNMPDVKGVDILRTLKTHPLTEGIPVLLLTGDDRGVTAQQCYEMKANGYICKPFNADGFLSSMSNVWTHC